MEVSSGSAPKPNPGPDDELKARVCERTVPGTRASLERRSDVVSPPQLKPREMDSVLVF